MLAFSFEILSQASPKCLISPPFSLSCYDLCPSVATFSLLTTVYYFLSVIDNASQSAVPSDAAAAPEAESGLRPLYMDVQATTPLVRMEGQLSLGLFPQEVNIRSENSQKDCISLEVRAIDICWDKQVNRLKF